MFVVLFYYLDNENNNNETIIIINDVFKNEIDIKKELIKEIKEIDDFTRLPIDLEKALQLSIKDLTEIYEEEYKKIYGHYEKIKFFYKQKEKEV